MPLFPSHSQTRSRQSPGKGMEGRLLRNMQALTWVLTLIEAYPTLLSRLHRFVPSKCVFTLRNCAKCALPKQKELNEHNLCLSPVLADELSQMQQFSIACVFSS